MSAKTNFKPEGYHTITPYLVVADAAAEIAFLEKAFGAELRYAHRDGDTVRHAEIRIGDSMLMLGQAREAHPPRPASLYLYVPDCDSLYRQALAAGAVSTQEPKDHEYGDRGAGVRDHEGNDWWIGTHFEDVSAAELERRMSAKTS